jgi:AP-3 complex subunit mu
LEFLNSFVDLLHDYFGNVSEIIIKDNFSIVYEVNEGLFTALKTKFLYQLIKLLAEILDYGYPHITEPCILKDIIPPPSILSTVINAVSIGTTYVLGSIIFVRLDLRLYRFGTKTPQSVLSQVPWRVSGLKYTNNEVYFDIVEELNIIIDRYFG